MAEIKLTPENFEKEVSQETAIIVDFWASWCGPCQMMGPVFEELSNDYDANKLRFGKCSTEECPDASSKYGITSIPCLVIFKAGKEVDRLVGFMPKDALKAKIDAVVEKL